MHLHLDAIGGIAGDMFAAALLDIWPELETELIAVFETIGLTHLVTVQRCDHKDHALTGSRYLVKPLHNHTEDHHHHHHHHHHRAFREIRQWLQDSDLAAAVTERAIAIFQILAEAEGKVHGVAVEDVEFHEVGAWDSIADIVTAAWLIETIGITSCSCSPLPMGSGRVTTAHGLLPVPAPATALLLEGFPLYQDELDGERITPTGAAILRHLQPGFESLPTALRLIRSGTGFGMKSFGNLSNILRAMVFDTSPARRFEQEQVAVCQFELDDQTAEDLAIGLDHLRELPEVLDVIQIPVFGKKGRIMMQIQILAKPQALDHVVERCFIETSTLGVRWQIIQRGVLERSIETCQIDGRTVHIKQAQRPTRQTTLKVESDDIRSAPGGLQGRETLRRRAMDRLSEDNHEF